MNTTDRSPTPTSRALTWCLHLLVIGLLALAAGRTLAGGRPEAGPAVAVAAAPSTAPSVHRWTTARC
ncbi:hypothetical protein ACWEN3_29310, partial [Streptomyces sp. NPDC004561]